MFVEIILFIIVLVGIAFGSLWMRSRLLSSLNNCNLELELSNQKLNQLQISKNELKDDLQEFKEKYEKIIEENTDLKIKNEGLITVNKMAKETFNEQKKIIQQEFENLANKVLEQKSQQFKRLNQESISHILNPVKKEILVFKERIEHLYDKETEQRIALKTELINLQNLNHTITQQASELTNALQGQKKKQGNWGELMLENILDGSGLRLGKDYNKEVSVSGEDGKQRPDVVIYLPKNKHIIIDAKTSLVAYTRYVNSENELEATQALAEHVQAVTDRIQELSARKYAKAEELNSPEVVIMFMPIESAYVEALKIQPELYQKAIESQVLVATPVTLLTSLSMVRQLWQFEEQNKHTAELAKRAEKFYSKLNGFLLSMQKVGKQLDSAKDSYETAFSQLYSGRGNLIKQAAEFKELGVSINKELPNDIMERANLELEISKDD